MQGLDNQVFSSAKEFIPLFANRVNWVNTMIENPPEKSDEEYAKLMYIEMIKSMVSGTAFGDMERSVHGYVGPRKKKLAISTSRSVKRVWTGLILQIL